MSMLLTGQSQSSDANPKRESRAQFLLTLIIALLLYSVTPTKLIATGSSPAGVITLVGIFLVAVFFAVILWSIAGSTFRNLMLGMVRILPVLLVGAAIAFPLLRPPKAKENDSVSDPKPTPVIEAPEAHVILDVEPVDLWVGWFTTGQVESAPLDATLGESDELVVGYAWPNRRLTVRIPLASDLPVDRVIRTIQSRLRNRDIPLGVLITLDGRLVFQSDSSSKEDRWVVGSKPGGPLGLGDFPAE